MSQIAFFTRDGDMRGWSRISRPTARKRAYRALIRATIRDLMRVAPAHRETSQSLPFK